jgi:hypothetical protein
LQRGFAICSIGPDKRKLVGVLIDLFDNPLLMLELIDGVLQLLVEDYPVSYEWPVSEFRELAGKYRPGLTEGDVPNFCKQFCEVKFADHLQQEKAPAFMRSEAPVVEPLQRVTNSTSFGKVCVPIKSVTGDLDIGFSLLYSHI